MYVYVELLINAPNVYVAISIDTSFAHNIKFHFQRSVVTDCNPSECRVAHEECYTVITICHIESTIPHCYGKSKPGLTLPPPLYPVLSVH